MEGTITFNFFFEQLEIGLWGPKYNEKQALAIEFVSPSLERQIKRKRQKRKVDVGREARESTSEGTLKRSEGLLLVAIALEST